MARLHTLIPPEFLSAKKLARRLGISPRTLYRWIAIGEVPLPTRRFDGKSVFWHLDDLPQEIRAIMRSDSRSEQQPSALVA